MRAYLFTLAPMLMVCAGAALEPCERVWAFLKTWELSNARAGFSRKEMAGYQGISEQQLSMQLALVNSTHPSLARAALAPDAVLLNFAEGICDLVGTARVIRDDKLDRLIYLAENIERHMVKAELPAQEKRRA